MRGMANSTGLAYETILQVHQLPELGKIPISLSFSVIFFVFVFVFLYFRIFY